MLEAETRVTKTALRYFSEPESRATSMEARIAGQRQGPLRNSCGGPFRFLGVTMIGSLCFISDDYFERFARDSLMRNHTREDGLGGRPYLIVFEDRRVPEVMWAVPLSSRYDKYAAIRQHKIERFGKCETIHLVGDMAGHRSVALIQNMIPITADAIQSFWTGRRGGPIRMGSRDVAEVTRLAKRTLKLEQHEKGQGNWRHILPDVRPIYDELVSEVRERSAMLALQQDPTILGQVRKRTEQGREITACMSFAPHPGRPATRRDIALIETQEDGSGRARARITTITDERFAERLRSVLDAEWEEVVDLREESFEASLDDAGRRASYACGRVDDERARKAGRGPEEVV